MDEEEEGREEEEKQRKRSMMTAVVAMAHGTFDDIYNDVGPDQNNDDVVR